MRNNLEIKLIAGVLIWMAIVASIVIMVRHSGRTSPQAVRHLVDYVGAQRDSIDIVSPFSVVIGIGDPVFMESEDGLKPVGMVTDFDFDQSRSDQANSGRPVRLAWVKRATVTFFSGRPPIGNEAAVELNATDQSPAWVVKTMMSPSMRKEITGLIHSAYTDHQEDLIKQFRPVIEKTIVDSARLIRDGIALELERRQDTVAAIGQRYQRDVVQNALIPVIQAEVWPIVQEEASPLVEQIGQEIWQEVSVWRFGWRFLYDKSPLPGKNLSQKEFDRFVQNKALPIFESHLEDVIELQQNMVARVLANEEVTATVSTAAGQFLSDPEVKQLFKEVFRHAVVNNPELRDSIEQTWRSTDAKQAMRMANNRLESTITNIGQAMFGSPNGKITTEFARVLRNRVLHKDDRWLVLKPGKPQPPQQQPPQATEPLRVLPLLIATADTEFPIGFSASTSHESRERNGSQNSAAMPNEDAGGVGE